MPGVQVDQSAISADLNGKKGTSDRDQRQVLAIFSGIVQHSKSNSSRSSDGTVTVISAGRDSYLEVQTESSPSEIYKFPVRLWTNPYIPSPFPSQGCKTYQFEWLFGKLRADGFIKIKFKPDTVHEDLVERLERVIELFNANLGTEHSGLNRTMQKQVANANSGSHHSVKQPVSRPRGVRVDDCEHENRNSTADRPSYRPIPNVVYKPPASASSSSTYPEPTYPVRGRVDPPIKMPGRRKPRTDYIALHNHITNPTDKENGVRRREVNGSTFGFGDGLSEQSFYGQSPASASHSNTSRIGRRSPGIGRAMNLNHGAVSRDQRLPAQQRTPGRSALRPLVTGTGNKFAQQQGRSPVMLQLWDLPPHNQNRDKDAAKGQPRSRLAAPSTTQPHTSQIVPEDRKGFSNIGNSCYMNVVLQALLNLDTFCERLVNSCITLDHFLPKNCLTRSLWQLFLAKDETLSSKKSDLLRQVKRSMRSLAFDNYAQQDSHEFLTAVLDQTRVELRAAGRLYSQANQHKEQKGPHHKGDIEKRQDHMKKEDNGDGDIQAQGDTDKGHIGLGLGDEQGDRDTDEGNELGTLTDQQVDSLVNQKASCAPQHDVIAHTFGFNMQQLIKCASDSCGSVIRRTQFFAELAVADSDEARKQRGLHLEQLLNICHGEEPIDEFKCAQCEHVGVINSTQIVHLPEIMVIQVKRYVYDAVTNTQRKSQRAVIFPHLLALDAHYDPSPLTDTLIKPDEKKEAEPKEEPGADPNNNEHNTDQDTQQDRPFVKDSSVQSDESFVTAPDASPKADSTAGGFSTDAFDLDETIEAVAPDEKNMPDIAFANELTPTMGVNEEVPRLSSDPTGSGTVVLHSPIRRRRPATQLTAINTNQSDEKHCHGCSDDVPGSPERTRVAKRKLSATSTDTDTVTASKLAQPAPKRVSSDLFTTGSPQSGARYNVDVHAAAAEEIKVFDIEDDKDNQEDNPGDSDLQKAMYQSLMESQNKERLEEEEKRREERELERALEESQLQSAIEQSKWDMQSDTTLSPSATAPLPLVHVEPVPVRADTDDAPDAEPAPPSYMAFVPATGNEQCVYRLTAVLSHLGLTNNAGHYICDVYKPSSDSWQSCDDSTVSHISLDTVLRSRQSSAYILLYQRIHNKGFGSNVKVEKSE